MVTNLSSSGRLCWLQPSLGGPVCPKHNDSSSRAREALIVYVGESRKGKEDGQESDDRFLLV